jgi:DNA-binding PadR family transcriptional regulator
VSIKNRINSRLSPEYVLLGFLYQHAGHGYELHRRLRDEFGNIWHASQSQTYNILKRLEAQGYISSRAVEQEKLPPRLLLSITEQGKERFEYWLNQPTKSSVHAIRVEFVTRLYFTELYHSENTQDMIREQIEVVKSGLTQLQASLVTIPTERIYDRLALELRIQLLSSVINWLNAYQETCKIRNKIEKE